MNTILNAAVTLSTLSADQVEALADDGTSFELVTTGRCAVCRKCAEAAATTDHTTELFCGAHFAAHVAATLEAIEAGCF